MTCARTARDSDRNKLVSIESGGPLLVRIIASRKLIAQFRRQGNKRPLAAAPCGQSYPDKPRLQSPIAEPHGPSQLFKSS